jgi:DNA-binding GntR family transcriptional regulator
MREGTEAQIRVNDQLIQALGTAARIACAALAASGHEILQASLDEACGIPVGSGWERRAAEHARFFTTLADAARDPFAAPVLRDGAAFAYELMIGVGRAADGVVISSRREMLFLLRSGDADAAAREMEQHLRVLNFMSRLFSRPVATA